MTTTLASSSPLPSSTSTGALIKAGLTGGAIAALANTAVYAGARLAGVDFVGRFDPRAPAQALFPLQPAIASLVPSLFAALLMLGMSKVFQRPNTPFVILATAFTVLSLGGPFMIAEASLATKIVLDVMHVIAAVAITLPLIRAEQSS